MLAMTPTTASTKSARSSQVCSTERRAGVSKVAVVIEDMAIGNPAYPVAQRWRFWASFPGIHIAQFGFEVIENCGVNALMRCNISDARPVSAAHGLGEIQDDNAT